jgi:hypothetical protein
MILLEGTATGKLELVADALEWPVILLGAERDRIGIVAGPGRRRRG